MKLINTIHSHPIKYVEKVDDYVLSDTSYSAHFYPVICSAYVNRLLNFPDTLCCPAILQLSTLPPNGNYYKITKTYSGPFCSVPKIYAHIKKFDYFMQPYLLLTTDRNPVSVPFMYIYKPLNNILSSFPSNQFYLTVTLTE